MGSTLGEGQGEQVCMFKKTHRPGEEEKVCPLSLPLCLRVVSLPVTWEPLLGLLQLLCALDGVCLVLGPPLGHLAVGLGQRPLQLGLGFLLLLILSPQQVTVVAGGPQGLGQGALGLRNHSGDKLQKCVAIFQVKVFLFQPVFPNLNHSLAAFTNFAIEVYLLFYLLLFLKS